MFLLHSDDFQHALFSTCFLIGGLKSRPPSVNSLFKGIPFSQEDERHEHMLESLKGIDIGISHSRYK